MAEQQTPASHGAAAPAPAQTPPVGALASKEHYRDGKLTRHGMEAVVAKGGSVIYEGRIITNARDLPSEAQLSKGNEAAESAARDNIKARRDALDREEALMEPVKAKK